MSFNKDDLFNLFASMTCTIEVGKRSTGAHTIVLSERVNEFPLVAIEKLFRKGFQREFNDSVGGLQVDRKVIELRKMIAEYKAGDIGRTKGEGVTDLTYECRIIAANLLRVKKPDEWKQLKDAEKKVLNARLDAIVTRNSSIVTDAQAVLDRKSADRERMARLNVEVDL
jgi:hypothetical protein